MEALNRTLRLAAAAALTLGLTVAAPVWATDQGKPVGSFDVKQAQDIGEIVRQYILDHPEVIFDSVQKAQVQQRQAEEQKRREAAGGVKRSRAKTTSAATRVRQ